MMKIFLELVRDYKSRKFLATVVFLFALFYIVENKLQIEWWVVVTGAVMLSQYLWSTTILEYKDRDSQSA